MHRKFLDTLHLAPDAPAGAGLAELDAKSVWQDGEFERVVINGVNEVRADQKKLTLQYGELDKTTKAAFEDLTKVKKNANDTAETITALQRTITALRRDISHSIGDPIQRIVRDEEKSKMFAAMVAVACQKGGDLPLKPHPSLEANMKYLYEGATPGSTMIISELARDVYDTLAGYGAWSTLGVRNVGTQTTTFPVKTARPLALWYTTQGGQIATDSTQAGTSVDCTIRTIASLVGVSRELIEDAQIDVIADVLADFAEAVSYRLDYTAFCATGTSNTTMGGYTGVCSYGTAADAAAGNTTIASLQLEDFVRCLTTVNAAVLGRAACWWMHPQTLSKICLVRDANNRPIFQNALEAPLQGQSFATGRAIGSILGRPVILANAFPSTDSAGQPVAAFGDPQAFVVGIRRNLELAASEHHWFDYNQMAFRGLMRAGVIGRVATGLAILKTAAS